MTPALLTRTSSRACREEHGIGGSTHGHQVGQVELQQLQGAPVELALQLVAGPARLLLVTAGEDHVRPVIGERPRGLVADATVGARDQCHVAREVADVVGAPGGAPRRLASRNPLTRYRCGPPGPRRACRPRSPRRPE